MLDKPMLGSPLHTCSNFVLQSIVYYLFPDVCLRVTSILHVCRKKVRAKIYEITNLSQMTTFFLISLTNNENTYKHICSNNQRKKHNSSFTQTTNSFCPMGIYITIIRPIVIYGCVAWCNMTLTDHKHLSSIENRIIRTY